MDTSFFPARVTWNVEQYGMETQYSISHGTVGVGFFGLLTRYGRGRIVSFQFNFTFLALFLPYLFVGTPNIAIQFANDPRMGLIDPDHSTAPK